MFYYQRYLQQFFIIKKKILSFEDRYYLFGALFKSILNTRIIYFSSQFTSSMFSLHIQLYSVYYRLLTGH